MVPHKLRAEHAVRRRGLIPQRMDIGGQVAGRQAPLPRVVLPLRVVEVVRGPAAVPGIGQRVSQKPASGSLDAADDVAPYRLHEQSLPRSKLADKADFRGIGKTLTRASTDVSGRSRGR